MSKNILSSNHLKLLFKDKGYESFNELKAEIVLVMIENFINHYIHSEESGKSRDIFDDTPYEANTSDERADRLIFNRLKKLREDILNSNILTITELNNRYNKSSFYERTLLTPYTVMYNVGINALLKAKKELFSKDEQNVWLPDVLSIYMIIDSKALNIPFEKYPFIHNDTFDDIVDIFMRINSKFRERDNTVSLYKNPTIVMKTGKMSSRVCSAINNIKYK